MIELRSDTFTLPTSAMMSAIATAPLGDDVYDEDPTVRALESTAADILGKEAAALLPSGTMANLCAMLTHCARGQDVILGNRSDLYVFEAGGMSVLGGIAMNPVKTEEDGTLAIPKLAEAIRDGTDPQCAPSRLVAIENTQNWYGGRVLPLAYLDDLVAFCRSSELKLHMDGARLFNAAVALGVSLERIAASADSVQVCLSKGLGAPVGSVLAGGEAFVANAKRWRKMLGGGMRQAGIIAAAGLEALREGPKQLAEDHDKAKLLADYITRSPRLKLLQSRVETNIIIFGSADNGLTAEQIINIARQAGVSLSELGSGRVRAVTHKDVSFDDIHHTGRILMSGGAAEMA